jgi:ribosomal protein S18 acetylase RimI-like enzyme
MDDRIYIVALGAADSGAVLRAARLFDAAPQKEYVARFLAAANHHLLLAYDGEQPVGFVSGVELTHPDKGTEMFLYELSVDEAHRRRGIGRSLVSRLGELARERGCYGMFVLTEADNEAALATYRFGGVAREDSVMLTWEPPPFDDDGSA